jgi:hypothetical protein
MERRHIEIKAKEEDLKGIYLVARILISPAHAKRRFNPTGKCKKYEDRFGEIEAGEKINPEIGLILREINFFEKMVF